MLAKELEGLAWLFVRLGILGLNCASVAIAVESVKLLDCGLCCCAWGTKVGCFPNCALLLFVGAAVDCYCCCCCCCSWLQKSCCCRLLLQLLLAAVVLRCCCCVAAVVHYKWLAVVSGVVFHRAAGFWPRCSTLRGC